jgi:hypothetical protein
LTQTSALVGFIDPHRDRFGAEPACAVLEFPASTYYAAKKREREPSRRQQRDEWLKKEIMRVWEDREKGSGSHIIVRIAFAADRADRADVLQLLSVAPRGISAVPA